MPPAAYSPFVASTSSIFPSRRSSPTVTVTTPLFQRAKTATVAHMKESRPPAAFEVAFARRAIAPLIPAPPKFANHDSACDPSHAV